VLGQVEAVLEMASAADTASELEQLIGRSGWRDDAQALVLRSRPPGIDVAQRHEIEHVIRMHVADHHGIKLVGMMAPHELRDHTGPDVDQHARAAGLDEVAGARLARVGRGGGASEHGEPHQRRLIQRCSIGM
jgi:hypothetical protein